MSIVNGTVVGSAEGCIADKFVTGVIDLKGKCREEEEGASFEGGEDVAAGLKATRAKGVERTAELKNMEAISTLNNLAVQTIHGSSNTLNFRFSIIANSDIPIGNLSAGGEGGIVVEYNFGGASISAAV